MYMYVSYEVFGGNAAHLHKALIAYSNTYNNSRLYSRFPRRRGTDPSLPNSDLVPVPPSPIMETPPKTHSKPDKQDKSLHKEESRPRLPSIQQLQEKLRKRWPRSIRGKESSEKDKPSPKYWKSAPRMVGECL